MATQRKRAPKIAAPSPNGAREVNGGFPIRVNIEKLTWEDMKIIIGSSDLQEFTPERVMDIHGLFDRVVEGGAKAVPVIYTEAAINAIAAAMAGLGNPKNSTPA